MSFRIGGLNLNAVAQGVGGLVFGNGERGSDEEDDRGVELLLERISDGRLAEDRRAAMSELRDAVAEHRSAQLALGAMGFPILLQVLTEEREDLEMMRGALEVLVNGLSTAGDNSQGDQVVPGVLNSELLSREGNSITLLLNLLEEEDFYVRYHTVQLLTLLLTNSPHRVQEAIVGTSQGVVRLMDMLQEREVIRNEALLLLINLTRSAEEVQKIAAFEGAFERVWAIIHEEGSSDGGIVVQDSLEFLNNLLRNNPSNQVLLRETMGLRQISSFLRIRHGDGDGLSRQKAANLLCALETVVLLLTPSAPPGSSASLAHKEKDTHLATNQTMLQQSKLMDSLLSVALEGRVSSMAVRTQALRALGALILNHGSSREELGSKQIAAQDDSAEEPALNKILRIALQAGSHREWSAAEHVVSCFCKGNPEGQIMLASTITPLPHSSMAAKQRPGYGEQNGATFGSILAQALLGSDARHLEASCRAASVLAHILRDNPDCKERLLRIPLEIPSSSHSPPELLLPRIMRHLAASLSSSSSSSLSASSSLWLPPLLLRLLVIWLQECPPAVAALLHSPAHLPLLLDLLAAHVSPSAKESNTQAAIAGLAAILLGECILYNRQPGTASEASTVLDVLTHRVGLTAYFTVLEDMQRSSLFLSSMSRSRLPKPITRSTAGVEAAADSKSGEDDASSLPPMLHSLYDPEFTKFVAEFEQRVRDCVMSLFSKSNSGSGDDERLQKRAEESVEEYAARLKKVAMEQAKELSDIVQRNRALTEDLVGRGGEPREDSSREKQEDSSVVHVNMSEMWAEAERLRTQVIELQKGQVALEAEVAHYRMLASKNEADLQALSGAYNSLEQDNFRLENKLQEVSMAASAVPSEDVLETVRQEGREEAQKESEAELHDLLVCLGQEETKVQKLRIRLEELDVDVDALLETVVDNEEEEDDESVGESSS